MAEERVKSALVVDDSKSARFALRKLVEGFGYQVHAAEGADVAMTWLQSQRPDVIFLDHMMPGADGFEVLRQIKSNARTVTIPVVICSSHEEPEFVDQARSRGATDVLLKPPTAEQVREVLKRIEPMSAVLRKAAPALPPAPVAAPAPVTAPKVQSIRAPDAAIEQRVMQNLRDALAPEPAAAPPPVAVAEPPAERVKELREQLDSKLRKLTQDFYAQLAEIKSHIAGLDEAFTDPDKMREIVREEIRNAMAALREDLLNAARAEAQAESERTVMNAAGRISEQMSQSLITSLTAGTANLKR